MSVELSGGADPRALVPGDPDRLEVLAANLGAFALGMTEAAGNLRAAGSGRWVGAAGDAFRAVAGEQPHRFENAGNAFGRAKVAVLRYAAVLRDAQTTAARAVVCYRDAEQLSTIWQSRMNAYQTAEAASERASSASHTRITVDVARPPPDDPGDAERAGAARLLADAHASVDAAARLTQAALAAAERDAPTRPSIWHRFTHDLGDVLHGAAHVAEGVGDGLLDMGKGVWSLTGAVATDPHQFAGAWQGMSALTDVADPYAMQQAWVGFGRSFVDADEWSKEPGRAFGHTLANVGVVAAGGGGLAARGGEAAEAGTVGPAAMRAGKVASRAESAPLAEALRAPHVQGEPWELSPSQMPGPQGWSNPRTLTSHVERHGGDFSGATTADSYVEQAREFYMTAIRNRYAAKVYIKNQLSRIRIYDKSTNRFLVVNTDGSIVTYYRPTSEDYWVGQEGDTVEWR